MRMTTEEAYSQAIDYLNQNCDLASKVERADPAMWNLNRALVLVIYALIGDLTDLKKQNVLLHKDLSALAEKFSNPEAPR